MSVASAASIFFTSPDSTLPGPNSTNLAQPSAWAAATSAAQLVVPVTCSSMHALIAPGSESCGLPVTLESTGIFGELKAMPSSTAASFSRAGAMYFEWNAPAVASGIARLTPSSFATSAAAATSSLEPESTCCAAELMFATVQPVLAHSSSSCAGVAPTIAIMPDGVASQASCMNRPRASSTFSVESKSRTPAAHSALHSPSDRPAAAANAVGRRFCSSV